MPLAVLKKVKRDPENIAGFKIYEEAPKKKKNQKGLSSESYKI